jgi:NADH-ubiquinone oxidoreductase chain 5
MLFNLYVNYPFFTLGYTFFNKKWFFDKLQNEVIGSFLLKTGYNITYKIVDKGLIELFGPSGISHVVSIISKQVSQLESGKINQYAFLMFISLTLLMSISLILPLVTPYIDLQLTFMFILYIVINNTNLSKTK